MLDVLDLPAFVTGATFDVLAADAGARALSPEPAPGRDRLRPVLLAPAERALHRGRDATTQRFVALVREAVGRGPTTRAPCGSSTR